MSERSRGADATAQRLADLERETARLRAELTKEKKNAQALVRSGQRAEQTRRFLEESLAYLQREGSDVVLRLTAAGKILSVSGQCRAQWGLEPASLTGQSFWDLLAPESQPDGFLYFQKVLEGTPDKALLVSLFPSDRVKLNVQLSCQALSHPQTQEMEYLCLVRLLPGMCADAHPGALPLEKVAFSSLVHELNQPLTALALSARAFARLARDRQTDWDEVSHNLDEIADQAERAGELVRRMRRLVSRGAPRRSTIHVHDSVQEALATLKQEISRLEVRIQLQFAPDVPTVLADRIQIHQVLVNLIRNAVEAMSDVSADRRALTLETLTQQQELVVKVSDTGPGIAAEIAPRLFQPFQTTKAHGMGLGLTLCQSILQAHSGRLWVESSPGRGTTIGFALPLSEDHE
ncbi:MAG: ATP-binding protein [Gemmataceae bacterium]|nr:ATP-binding protein [Gemmataceae bacterium]